MASKISLFVLSCTALISAWYRFSAQDYVPSLIRQYISLPKGVIFPKIEPGYAAQLIATDPLLITIADSLNPNEVSYLVAIETPLFQRSLINSGKITSQRTFDLCFLPSNDTVVSLVEQLVRYIEDRKVDSHVDWYQS
jgi:hypothetical protein